MQSYVLGVCVAAVIELDVGDGREARREKQRNTEHLDDGRGDLIKASLQAGQSPTTMGGKWESVSAAVGRGRFFTCLQVVHEASSRREQALTRSWSMLAVIRA